VADEYERPETAPVSLRVEQSSVPVSTELAVPPEIVLDTAASGAIARVVAAPTVTSVTDSGPLAGNDDTPEPDVELQEYVPEYVPALQSAS